MPSNRFELAVALLFWSSAMLDVGYGPRLFGPKDVGYFGASCYLSILFVQ